MATTNATQSAYILPVWETITKAWEKTNGAKGTLWGAFGMIILVSILFGVVEGVTKNAVVLYGLVCLIGNVIAYFMQLGLLYMGIKRAADQPIEWKMVFSVLTDFNKALWVVAAYFIMFLVYIPPMIITAAGIFLLGMSTFLAIICFIASFLIFIYLSARLILTVAYILATDMNAIEAVKASYYATQDNVLNVIGIIFMQAIIIAVSAIPLGIGLIWTIPFALVLYGLMFQRLRINVAK